MASFSHDCPHCGTVRAGFSIGTPFPCTREDSTVGLPAICNICIGPVIAVVRILGTTNPAHYVGDVLKDEYEFELRAFYPAAPAKDTPQGIPASVARAYDQAAGSRLAGHFDAACGMYRKAMELGLKAFSPDIEAWKLEKRIDRMAAEHRITPELQTWAHELRLDGNDAMHGDDEATKEMADQMHELCRFLLIYLYTLPLQVEAAQSRRGED